MSSLKRKTYGVLTYRDYRRLPSLILYGALVALSILMVFVSVAPPLWTLLSSLKDVQDMFAVPPTLLPKTFDLSKFVRVWQQLQFGRNFLNSLILVIGAVIASIIFNGLLAYGLSKMKPKGGKVVYALVLWSLMIPNTISLVPLFKNIVSLGLINSFLPLWLGYGAQAFNVVLYRSFFNEIPDSYYEAARLDGSSYLRTFFSIIVPLSIPIFIVIGVFTFNAAWSDYLLPFLVLKAEPLQTVMIRLQTMSQVWGFSVDYRLIAVVLSLIPPLLAFVFFQRHITQGLTLSGIRG